MKDDEIKVLIANVARQEFIDQGYVNASMRNISSKAGLTTGSLYNRFRDKAELFEYIVGDGVKKTFDLFIERNVAQSSRSIEEQKIALTNYDQSIMKTIIESMFDNYDSFNLVINKGVGSPYEHFMDKLIDIATANTLAYVEAKLQDKSIAKDVTHLLNAALFDAICEIFRKGYSKDQASSYMKCIFDFYNAGWTEILNDKQ